jgi:hypothetical protein
VAWVEPTHRADPEVVVLQELVFEGYTLALGSTRREKEGRQSNPPWSPTFMPLFKPRLKSLQASLSKRRLKNSRN